MSYAGSRFTPELAHHTTSDERNRQTQDHNTDRAEPVMQITCNLQPCITQIVYLHGEKKERNETHDLVNSLQDTAAENKSAQRERRKGAWRKVENGVVKGPYEELRLEDYLILAEKTKKAQVK